MPELDSDPTRDRTIGREKDSAVQSWIRMEGWSRPEPAVWKQDPDVGFWVWRHSLMSEPVRILAIHEPLVRLQSAQGLVATLNLLGLAAEIRMHEKVRVWEGGDVTHY
jgi:hypothetical protein